MSIKSKVLTQQCPSCNDCFINDNNQFECSWGKSKDSKILTEPRGRPKVCRLVVDKKTRKKYALH